MSLTLEPMLLHWIRSLATMPSINVIRKITANLSYILSNILYRKFPICI